MRWRDAENIMLLEAITTYYLPQYAFLQAELPKLGPVRGGYGQLLRAQPPV